MFVSESWVVRRGAEDLGADLCRALVFSWSRSPRGCLCPGCAIALGQCLLGWPSDACCGRCRSARCTRPHALRVRVGARDLGTAGLCLRRSAWCVHCLCAGNEARGLTCLGTGWGQGWLLPGAWQGLSPTKNFINVTKNFRCHSVSIVTCG